MPDHKPKRVSNAKRFAQIERISILGITERMGPLGLHLYAHSYLKAAEALPKPDVPFDPVRSYLVCHAIELSLKAYLSLKGVEMITLADGQYGHRLSSILDAAEKAGLSELVSLSEARQRAIRDSETYYAGKVFEYPAVGEALSGYPEMPDLDVLLETAKALTDALAKPCREAR